MTTAATELRTKWIFALRSGEYTQTDACLKSNQGFCAMGVLLDVIDKDAWVPAEHPDDAVMEWRPKDKDGSRMSRPPMWVRDLIQIKLEEVDCIMEMNDGGHMSFEKLADALERNTVVQLFDELQQAEYGEDTSGEDDYDD